MSGPVTRADLRNFQESIEAELRSMVNRLTARLVVAFALIFAAFDVIVYLMVW